ncbi:FecR family protein [Mucilaginibacter rubeus]|uniref:FecR family protein n=1 Tax=Mucilaginibacter rubeus TaxID=2027860 RepID=A0AAE6ML65_9SPHI|nr:MULTISPECIES: FecR family protein [Mucilaginibacter]QEM07533.1 FecR family protein [Mucilaginibacter rubeus]QEM19987.1 FecR family protein [Mucilaginibacter gossypii]QTE43305.1 FecR family protein [Mucilaginibacter rubeus]QTE49905.1 FecR family protein [Mucilaginibacter rubeus]QTE54996.1 FecR family protein [Mucilaginibacter rubeus]
MDNEEVKLLLVKYITGEATLQELEQVKQWISAHPENEQYFVQLYETWHNMLYLQPAVVNKDNAYNKLSTGMEPAEPSRYARLISWGKVAAAVALLAAVTVTLYNRYSKNAESVRQIAANPGAIKKIVLSDGTQVWLNADSKLNYTADFGKITRTVYLEGEAFFDIAPGKKEVPFIVNTKNYTIRDIGTKFNLKAYASDPFFETTVVKGEVSVEGNIENNAHEMSRIYVKPRQVLRIYYHPKKENYSYTTPDPKSLNEIQVSEIDSAKLDRYDGWKENLLVFDGATLSEIAKVLERRYNVTINMTDAELSGIRYSGSFKNIQSIEKVLAIIKANTAINYSINGNTVNITRNNNND